MHFERKNLQECCMWQQKCPLPHNYPDHWYRWFFDYPELAKCSFYTPKLYNFLETGQGNVKVSMKKSWQSVWDNKIHSALRVRICWAGLPHAWPHFVYIRWRKNFCTAPSFVIHANLIGDALNNKAPYIYGCIMMGLCGNFAQVNSAFHAS